MRRWPFIGVLFLAIGCAAPRPETTNRVILFIGDGVGSSYWTAARFAAGDLSVQAFKIVGLVDTRSSNSWITDSAAGATAYAAGVRTFNGAIGVGPDSTAVMNVLEIARDRGWATGVVATSSVTHATPASFVAHVPARSSENEIARQLLETGPNVFLGGGEQWFDPAARPDSLDLLTPIRQRYTFVRTAEELAAVDTTTTTNLAGLFAASQMPAARERTPSLPAMTRAALRALHLDPDGFFLMVEGSQPDWRGHANEPIEAVTAEVLDFDAAIGVGLEYQRAHPETLIIVLADHETGGLAIETALDSAGVEHPVAAYTTRNHTGQMIPLFAGGPRAAEFGGIIENRRVGQLLMEIVRGGG